MIKAGVRESRLRPALALVAAWAIGWAMGHGATIGSARADDAGAKTASLEARVAALETKLEPLTRQGNDLYITRANLHIVNGLGSTDTTNGLGNLIIGYNELRDDKFNARIGSHNLVVGKRNNYSSYGGVVFGLFNHASGPYSVVCGGSGNKPLGFAATVCGGRENVAAGQFSCIAGGTNNHADAEYSAIGGGKGLRVLDANAWAAGGTQQPR
jgi:hypothetical protein